MTLGFAGIIPLGSRALRLPVQRLTVAKELLPEGQNVGSWDSDWRFSFGEDVEGAELFYLGTS